MSWSHIDILTPYLPLLGKGLLATVVITLLSLVGGLLLGLGVYGMTRSSHAWVRRTASVWRSLLRGTPLMVLILLFYYVVFSGHAGLTAAVLAFSCNLSTFVCSLLQSSIDSVGRGQTEAAISLGFTRYQMLRYIVAPQALRNALPAFKYQAAALLKGTSVVGYVSILDLTQVTQAIRTDTGLTFIPLVVITILYMLLAWLLIKLLDHLANRTNRI